jgi:drug/metabolite transporter (DMT)-like permease
MKFSFQLKNQVLFAHLLLVAVALIYGSNYVLAKYVMPDPIPANAFILFRAAGATVLFWVFLRKYWVLPKRGDILRLILCGLTGVAINQTLFFNGLSLTAPLHAAIIMTTTPIIVLLFSVFWLKQKTTRLEWLGIFLGLIGAVGFMVYGAINPSEGASALGDLFIFVNAISYSVYLIAVKPLMKSYHALSIIPWIFTFGLIAIMPMGISELQNDINWNLSNFQWSIVAFVIVGVTFLTYLFNIIAIQLLSPTHAGVYIYLQPPLAAVFSVMAGISISSVFNPMKILFTGLILLGIYWVSLAPKD